MMKAQVRELDEEVTVQVCGRVAEGWVSELEACWQAARAGYPNRRFSVDLRGVTFIDQTGEYLLKQMHRDGARFLTAGVLIREVVNQVTGGLR